MERCRLIKVTRLGKDLYSCKFTTYDVKMQLIENVLGSKNRIRVLRYLAKHINWEFNITELSRDIDINKGILSRLIKKLKEENLIKINRKGKIILFKINKENLIIKTIFLPLFEIEEKFFGIYVKPKILKIKSKNIISIIVYGSYARNDFKLNSDIDIMVIVKIMNNKIVEDFEKIKKEFLNEDVLLNVDIIWIKEFRKLYKTKEPLMMSIKQEGQIIRGKKIEEIL